MSASKIILVTGANAGVGFGLVRILAQRGHVVYIGARSVERGEKARQELMAEGLKSVKLVQLDVTSVKSVDTARDTIESAEGRLDSLVNNAAIAGSFADPSMDLATAFRETIATNYIGAVRVCTAFTPLLRKAAGTPTILNVTSALGSNTEQAMKPGALEYAPYAASKAALNSYTIHLAVHLKDSGFKINLASPGFASSRTNTHPAARPTEEGALSLLPWVTLDKNGPTGRNFTDDGNEQAW